MLDHFLHSEAVRSTTAHRRARPWLGTLVEVAALQTESGEVSQHTAQAIENAFAVIAHVHTTMSHQSACSELSVFNALKAGLWMPVSSAFSEVLAFSLQLSQLSAGVFDVCCTGGDWRSLVLDAAQQRIRKRAALSLDLSGVAKGYAVDSAVQALQAAGVPGGWVNAGGDLRVFGAASQPLLVRSAREPSTLHHCTVLQDRSAATSAHCLPNKPLLRHGSTRARVCGPASWTISAPTCMAADALTKVLAASGDSSHRIFSDYAAQAWIFD